VNIIRNFYVNSSILVCNMRQTWLLASTWDGFSISHRIHCLTRKWIIMYNFAQSVKCRKLEKCTAKIKVLTGLNKLYRFT
jgi:hypothetical protein